MGVGDHSVHFREPYPAPEFLVTGRGPAFKNPKFNGRKTILDEFHTDEHDPSHDPWGHLFYDVFGFPDGSLDWGPYVTTY
jgi:hypothetical protein